MENATALMPPSIDKRYSAFCQKPIFRKDPTFSRYTKLCQILQVQVITYNYYIEEEISEQSRPHTATYTFYGHIPFLKGGGFSQVMVFSANEKQHFHIKLFVL